MVNPIVQESTMEKSRSMVIMENLKMVTPQTQHVQCMVRAKAAKQGENRIGGRNLSHGSARDLHKELKK